MKKLKGFILIILSFLCVPFCNYKVDAVEGEKLVYLTFDDGPSPNNTNRILNVLKKNDVKASFFVVGKNVEMFPEIVKKMDKNNMDIYPHCNNHIYKELYSSQDFYFNDLSKCQESINKVTGKNVGCTFVRMPGGSDNLVGDREVLASIRNKLLKKGVDYVDWNVDSGDATAIRVAADIIEGNVNSGGFKYQVEVLLMHDLDNKNTTTEALETIINEYKVMGYKFKTLSEMEPWEKQYLENIRVINRR